MQRMLEKEGRHVAIRTMRKRDVKPYYDCFLNVPNKERKEKIKYVEKFLEKQCEEDPSFLFAVENEDKRPIAVIRCTCLENCEGMVELFMFNQMYEFRYGNEILDNFIRLCQEEQLYDALLLRLTIPVIQRYVIAKGISPYIKIA